MADETVTPSSGFGTSMAGRTTEANRRISDTIISVVAPALDRLISDYEFLGAAFLAKAPGEGGVVPVHQDWTAVDETVASSMNIWCALVDVETGDSPIEVLPGSHRWFRTYRSPVVPSVNLAIDELPQRSLVSVPVRAGQAVVYDHRLFHGSGPRAGTGYRPVAQLSVVPRGATVLTCVPGHDPDTLDLRVVDGSIFLRAFESPSPFDERPGRVWSTVRPQALVAGDVADRVGGEAPSRGRTPWSALLGRLGSRRPSGT